MRGQGRLRSAGRAVLITLILLWSAFPIYWALNTSFSTLNGAQSVPAHFVPSPFTAQNYRTLLSAGGGVGSQFWRSFVNATIESGLATVLTVVIALFAAYAFARLEFRGKRIILVAVLATLLLPVYATLIPLYRIMSTLHLVNTYLGIVLVYTSGFLPLAIWIMYNYFASVPRELEEAAFVDGATPVVALIRVMIPVSLPGIAATAIIVFLMGWAQFIFPLVLSSDLATQPVTVVVAALYGQRIVPFTLLNAIGVLAAALPAIIALLLNRYIVQGVMAGSIK
ncbi:MAG TPA: carbohydrate ABC transporter permease [Thermoleophilia bacterium]|nr:carbohydrate ABC transporter permease [Thermoleophilia bacterium]